MWQVSGIKIERTRAHYIFLCVCSEICEKVNFLVKRYIHKKFPTGKISGPVLRETLRTQDSENIIGFGDLASVWK